MCWIQFDLGMHQVFNIYQFPSIVLIFMYPLHVSIKHEFCMQLIDEGIRSTQHRSCVDSYMTFPTIIIMSCATEAQQMKTLEQLNPDGHIEGWAAECVFHPEVFAASLYALFQKSLFVLCFFSSLWSLFFGLCNSTALNLFYTTLPSRFLAFHPPFPFILGKILFY